MIVRPCERAMGMIYIRLIPVIATLCVAIANAIWVFGG